MSAPVTSASLAALKYLAAVPVSVAVWFGSSGNFTTWPTAYGGRATAVTARNDPNAASTTPTSLRIAPRRRPWWRSGSAVAVVVHRRTGGRGRVIGLAGQHVRHQDGSAQGDRETQDNGDDQPEHDAPPLS